MKEMLLPKVDNKHFSRSAYLYVRQSTLKQVCENTESTRRQYALADRAASLGWPREQIIVIDDDLGQSGSSAADRHGFQQLVSEVSLGKAGIVLGLEVSRLARNSADWHRLLEICALSDTLILDEDGLYDPTDFNDRLVLGLKGTFSEAELHILRARLRGGVLNKAHRGELRLPLPIGFVYDPEGSVVLDPDEQVQQSIRYLFETFRRTRSAGATVRVFRDESLLFPSRLRTGPRKGRLEWMPLAHSRVLYVLHNPRYAGTFVYGRREYKRLPTGWQGIRQRPMDEWVSCVLDAHKGYITWAQYQEHQQILRTNAIGHARGERSGGPAREGPALLQGLVICGRCGRRMTLRYHDRKGRSVPDYVCQRARIEYNDPFCQSVPGANVDDMIGAIVEEVVCRQTIDITLAVQQEVNARAEEVDRLHRKRVERARYEAEIARERYLCVDPRNRLVADSLERSWNDKLRVLRESEEQYEQAARHRLDSNDSEIQRKLVELVNDFPRIWNDPSVCNGDRKRIVRLIIEDVTLVKDKQQRDIHAHIRFKGGATRSVKLDTPVIIYEKWKTKPHIIEEIDRLLDDHTEGQIARLFTERGMTTSHGKRFRTENVAYLRHINGLRHRRLRLRDRGYVTLREMAAALGVSMREVRRRAELGEIETCAVGDRYSRLYRGHSTAGKRPLNPTADPHEGVSEQKVQYA
jgi:DNA invertase Pin-like site-specific DNA recombinase